MCGSEVTACGRPRGCRGPRVCPASRASSMFGWMPVATITVSHSITRSLRSRTPVTDRPPVMPRDAVAEDDLDAERAHVSEEIARAGLVELAHHEPGEVLDHADFRVEALHRARGLQSQQAAAEHDGAAAAHAPREEAMRVAHVAEGVDAGQPDAGEIGHVRARAGREHQRGIRLDEARAVAHRAPGAVDRGDRVAVARLDVRVCRQREIARQRLPVQLADEESGKPHAVVRLRLLLAVDDDGEIGSPPRQFLRGADADRAGADDDDRCGLCCCQPCSVRLAVVCRRCQTRSKKMRPYAALATRRMGAIARSRGSSADPAGRYLAPAAGLTHQQPPCQGPGDLDSSLNRL